MLPFIHKKKNYDHQFLVDIIPKQDLSLKHESAYICVGLSNYICYSMKYFCQHIK